MTGNIITLGAKGRFGRAAVDAFVASGWHVRAFARSWEGVAQSAGAQLIEGDAFDAAALARASQGCDVVVNALNPPYPQWTRDLPRLTANVIRAAKTSGATVMIPGNVYNYGERMPEILTENTPCLPTTRKGRLREVMEQAFAAAIDEGVRTIILRAGDFIEREKTGNWFDSYIAANVAKGRVLYPGPMDRMHAWAYLPDVARAMVGLAEKRAAFAPFESFGFPGHAVTGQNLVDAIERVSGRKLKVKGLSWPMIRLLGLAMPQMREVAEMSYLWRTPHAIDGSKLAATLPNLHGKTLEVAIADALGATSNETSLQHGLPQPV